MPSTAEALQVQPVARLCRALGDETRLRIVALLAHGELCVCHIEEALSLTQPTASRHLSVLRAAGIVEPRRDGTWIHYRLAKQADRDCQAVLRAISRSFGEQEQLRRDVERLAKVKKPGACSKDSGRR